MSEDVEKLHLSVGSIVKLGGKAADYLRGCYPFPETDVFGICTYVHKNGVYEVQFVTKLRNMSPPVKFLPHTENLQLVDPENVPKDVLDVFPAWVKPKLAQESIKPVDIHKVLEDNLVLLEDLEDLWDLT